MASKSKNISVCGRCSREVYHAEQRVAINKVWHAFCFSCAICNKLLDSCTINPYNGEIYCTTCFQQISAYDYDFDNDENSKRGSQSEKKKHHKESPKQQQHSPKPTTQQNHTPDSKSTHKPIRTPEKNPATVKSPRKDQKRTATPPQNKQSPKTKHRNLDESNSYHIKDLYPSPEKAHKLDKNKRRPSSASLPVGHLNKTPPKNVRKDSAEHYNIAGLFKTPKKQQKPFDDSDGYHLDKMYQSPEKPKDGKKLRNSPSGNYGIAGMFKTPKKKNTPFDDSDGYHLDKMYKTPEKLKNARSGNYSTAGSYKTPKKKHAPFDDSDGYHLDKMYQSPEKHQTWTKIGQDDSGHINLRGLFKTPKKKDQNMDETDNYHIRNLYPSPGKSQKDQKNTRNQRNFMDETDNYHIKDMYRSPEKPHRGQPKRTDSDPFYKTALSSTQFHKTPRKNHRDMDDTDNYNIDRLYPSPRQTGENRTIIPNSPRSPMNKSPKRNNNEEFYQTANYPNSPNRTSDDLYKTAMSNTPRSPRYRSPNHNTSEEFYQTANYQNSPNRTKPGDFYKTAISSSPRSPSNKSPNRTNSKEFYRTANFESTPNRTDLYKTATQNTPRSPRYNQPHRNDSEDFFQTPNHTNSPKNTTARTNSPPVYKTGVQHSPRNVRGSPNLYQTARRSPKNNFNETIYESATQLSPKKFSPQKLSFESMNSDDFFHNATTSTPQRPHQRNFTVGYATVPQPNPENFKSVNNVQLDDTKKKGFFSRWISRIIDRDKKEEKSPEKASNNPQSMLMQQGAPKRHKYVRYPMDESEYYNNDNTYQYPEEESINRGEISKPYEPQHLDNSYRVPENNYGWNQKDLQVYRVDKVSKPKIKNVRNPMDDTNNYNIDRLYQSPERNPRRRKQNLDDSGDYYIDKLYQSPQKIQQHYDDIDYHLDNLFATPPKHQRSPRRNPMDDTEDYNINQLYSTPPKHQRSPRRNPMDDTEDYNINQLYSTPPRHQRSPRKNPMDDTEDYNINQLYSTPPKHQRSPRRNPMDDTEDYNINQLYPTPERYKNKQIDSDPNRVRFNPNMHSTPAKKNNHVEYNNDTNQTRGKTKYGSEVGYNEKDPTLHDANRKPVCKSSCDSKNCYMPTPREISGYYSRKSKQRYCNSCFPEFDAYDDNPQNNDICKRCNRMVYIVEKVKAGGNCYHDCCFTCYICRRPLNSLNLLSRRGEIFCKHCHLKYFGPHTYGFGMLPNLSL